MTADLRLAAILALLSSSALGGVTPARAAALQVHLQAVRQEGECLDERLRQVLEQVCCAWSARDFPAEIDKAAVFFVRQSDLLH